MKRKRNLSDLTPPGADLSKALRIFWIALAVSAFVSSLWMIRLWEAYHGLFLYDHELSAWKLKPQAVMPDFAELLSGYPLAFAGVILVCLSGIWFHLDAFHRGSHSMYLMKRLPTRGELFRRVAVLPLLGCLIALLTLLVLVLAYYGIYAVVTPKECLQPNQAERFFAYYFHHAAYSLHG